MADPEQGTLPCNCGKVPEEHGLGPGCLLKMAVDMADKPEIEVPSEVFDRLEDTGVVFWDGSFLINKATLRVWAEHPECSEETLAKIQELLGE